jgi:hypothetical protein
MIVVDENSSGESVRTGIRTWYRGKVISVRDLLPGAVIKDELIPRLLVKETHPSFVTTNVSDSWQVVPADRRFSTVCLPLSNERSGEFSSLLRRTLTLGPFRTKRLRMGRVIFAAPASVRFYRTTDTTVQYVPWEAEQG